MFERRHWTTVLHNSRCYFRCSTQNLLDPCLSPCYIHLMKRKVTFLPDKVTVDVDDNTNLFRAVKASGVYVLSSCGGKGNCGKCKVVIKEETDRKNTRLNSTHDYNSY